MAVTLFRIPMGATGAFGLSVVDYAAAGYLAAWMAPAGKVLPTVALTDYHAGSTTWQCQMSAMALTSTPNIATNDRKGTFCQAPGQSITVGDDAFELEITHFQDPNNATGLQAFLYQNRTKELFWYFSANGPNGAPRAIGRTRATMSTIGGETHSDLEASLTLPVLTPPDIEFGTGGTTVVIGGGATAPPDRTSASNGDQFPAEATVTAEDSTNAAKLGPLGFIADPSSAWGSGHFMKVGPYRFAWNGSAWASGPRP